jgi:sulfatase maturation enzyme AslB (radical SAM superfamily)
MTRIEPVALNLTHLCNLHCKHCNQVVGKSNYKFLTKEQYQIIAKGLRKVKFKSLGLTGGEPLLHPDLSWIIKNIKTDFPKKDLTIVTNGLLLKKLTKIDFDTFDQISISSYEGVNDDIVEYYFKLNKPNVVLKGYTKFYNPNLQIPNSVIFSKAMYSICPLRRLFIVGSDAYACCISNSIERVHNVKNLYVSMNDSNWFEKFKKIPTYKACIYCSYAELNRTHPSILFKTIFQTFKMFLQSQTLFRKLLLSGIIWKWRKERLIRKSGLRARIKK